MKNAELILNYNNLDLKKLPVEIRKGGFDYKLICRSEEKFIYSQHNASGKIIAYEFFLNRIKPWRSMKQGWAKRKNDQTDLSNEPEWYETFPSDEEFGKRAWTYPTLELALESFNGK